MTCQTCKHWSGSNEDKYAKCQRIGMRDEDFDKDNEEDSAFVVDFSGHYQPYFVCKFDFGCNLYDE